MRVKPSENECPDCGALLPENIWGDHEAALRGRDADCEHDLRKLHAALTREHALRRRIAALRRALAAVIKCRAAARCACVEVAEDALAADTKRARGRR